MRYMSISQSEIDYNNTMRLRELREDKDLHQSDLAQVLNIGQNTYSQYETGSRQIPIDCLIKLAKFYCVSVDYILELTDVDVPYPTK